MADIVWQPAPERMARSNMQRFIETVNRRRGLSLGDYPSLYQWSVSDKEAFWESLWDFVAIRAARRADRVVESHHLFWRQRWFPGAKLNFAENLLRHVMEGDPERAVMVFWGEDRVRREMTAGQLLEATRCFAHALRNTGVVVGDRVVGLLPNLPEAVVGMLATTSIGAIWSSCSPDFGVRGVVDRFGQVAPKVLLCADGYFFKGKVLNSLPLVREVVAQLPSLEKVVVVPYVGASGDLSGIDKAVWYDTFCAAASQAPLAFEPLPFDHPVYILYSSGTTGAPKCIVHGAGGTLLQHLKELVLHTDLQPQERLFYFTTCGWMMWNWMVSALAAGATLLLYDGSPFHPGPEILPEFAAATGMQVFGTSARYLAALEKTGIAPRHAGAGSSLRAVLSTGSPLLPESYDFVARFFGRDIQLSSISGGTDIISCFALGCPLLPVYRGQLQCRGLGMDVAIYNSQGQAVRGEKGELVCRQPFPSMPVSFWNDPEDARYRAAYFDKFPGVWAHGDYAELTDQDGLIIYGRSDAVLNPGGVRIGTAEIYRQVALIPEVLESIAVGQQWEGDVRVVLFVTLREGVTLDDELTARIRETIRTGASPRHVPAKILQVADIPRTISGKIVELAVREVIHGRPVTNTDALANPEALAYFRDRPELQEA